ncbi:MAG TPA: hypothetical protein DDZ81_01325 [Acetobacteraceae bacterium]|nr:hypothetical protein [Acetobacteraceae bacterium]
MFPAADPQQAVIDFLSSPASYGLGNIKIERVETHCSIVFLAADFAYKLKRAIRYASLDYTSDELRRRACESELRLNRRTAPDIYLHVRSINLDSNGVLAFDGPGLAVDHVVVMRRFAQSDLFDHLTDAGKLTPELMRSLGENIAHFHASAEITPRFGGSEAIRGVIADNDRELALVAAALDGASVETLGSLARIALGRVSALLDRRREEGSVRQCHGDLRLANICLYHGQPTLFDGIEFSDEIGCIDVLYDLAFLLMDLQLHGRGYLANMVFNAYLDHAPETDGLKALPLFLSLRAATRSYALAGGAQRSANGRQADRLMALARRHVAAAIGFLAYEPPILIMLGGNNDESRTQMAMMLAAVVTPAPGARVVHLGSSGEATWHEVFAVLAAGCSVLVDGSFTANDERNVTCTLPSAIKSFLFWFGPLPSALTEQNWRIFGDSTSVLAAVASAASLVTVARVDSRPFSDGRN